MKTVSDMESSRSEIHYKRTEADRAGSHNFCLRASECVGLSKARDDERNSKKERAVVLSQRAVITCCHSEWGPAFQDR
eukprot:scaffold112314_cov18-Tisochrysis_lutea.AAC.1